ncbi:curlin repeat-containing protein [Methylorubrum aminovorans]|nr:hypothetical protein CLZ_00120 [Methylobacterium sp. CLZ]QIJ78061.1 hypothetical protein GU700_00120 [Methylobacterium sp. NI91]
MLNFRQVTALSALFFFGVTPILAAEVYIPQAGVGRASDLPSQTTKSPLVAAPISLEAAQATAATMPAGNTAQIVQIGTYNSGTISQTGAGNVAALYQQGQGNFAVISQTSRGR